MVKTANRERKEGLLGGYSYSDFAELTKEQLLQAAELFKAAIEAQSFALASSSDFPVGAAALLTNGKIVTGSNLEFGGGLGAAECRAIHAEQSLVASAAKEAGLGKNDCRIEMLATSAANKLPTYCCGNCLDVVMSYSHPETLVIAGNEGDCFEAHRITDCLPNFSERFQPLSKLAGSELSLAQHAIEASSRSFSPLAPGYHSAAAARLSSGELISAVRVDGADYHPVSALEGLVSGAYAQGSAELDLIALCSEDGSISGRDRQRLYQFAGASGKLESLKLLLIDKSKESCGTFSPKELLPFGFSARDIGKQAEVEEYFRSLRARSQSLSSS